MEPIAGDATKRDIGHQRADGIWRWLAPLCAAVLGVVLLYGAGFVQTEAIHNGAHDARHAAGFPCH
jgi:cobalt transporter subunit CbtB